MLTIKTEIASASIFRSGAEVIRKGHAELKEGPETLCILGLPQTADLDTVRLFSSEGVSCSDLRFEYPKPEEDSPSAKITEEIETLQKDIETRELQISLWQSNGDFTNRLSQTAGEIEEYIEKLPGRIQEIRGLITAAKKKISSLEKEREQLALEEQLPVAIAEVSAPSDGMYNFELRYHESSAQWESIYEIHSDSKNPLEIRSRAKIIQNTYEDWKKISVRLFTGNPSGSNTLPEIPAVFLDIQQPVQARSANAFLGAGSGVGSMKMAMSMATEEAADMAVDDMVPMVRMDMAQAQVNSDEAMTEFILPGVRDIFKGYTGTMADLAIDTVKADYKTAAVPKMDPNAYLIAEVASSDLPDMKSNYASIYLNGIFSGGITVDPNHTKDTIVISLGKDERVHVSRKEISHKTSNALLKGTKTTEFIYETSVANVSGQDVKVLLKDQIPVSQNKEITVDAVDLSGASLDEETGLLSKEFTLKADASETVRLAYKVTLPKDKTMKQTPQRISSSSSYPKWCPECGAPTNGSAFCNTCGYKLK